SWPASQLNRARYCGRSPPRKCSRPDRPVARRRGINSRCRSVAWTSLLPPLSSLSGDLHLIGTRPDLHARVSVEDGELEEIKVGAAIGHVDRCAVEDKIGIDGFGRGLAGAAALAVLVAGAFQFGVAQVVEGLFVF